MNKATTKQRGPHVNCSSAWKIRGRQESYCSHGLHAQNEGIRREVSAIRERIFLPELAKKILCWAHSCMVEGEVTFEEEVD